MCFTRVSDHQNSSLIVPGNLLPFLLFAPTKLLQVTTKTRAITPSVTNTGLTLNAATNSHDAKVMPSDSEIKGCTQPPAKSLESPTPPASGAQNPQSRTPTSLMPTSKIPQPTAQSSSMPEPSPQLFHEAVLPSGNIENAAELHHGSCSTKDPKDSEEVSGRSWLPRNASPALPEPTEPQASSPSSKPRPSTPAGSPTWQPNVLPTGPTAGSTPSQPLDAHNRSIIAASATLAYLQRRCRRGNPPADSANDSTSTKVKALTSLCKGLLRKPGETIAISADVYQSEILLAVAHEDGSCIPPEKGTSEGEQPEK